jgi:hypothetical protein
MFWKKKTKGTVHVLGISRHIISQKLNLRALHLGRSKKLRFPCIYKPAADLGLAFRISRLHTNTKQKTTTKSARYFNPKQIHFAKLSWMILVAGSSVFKQTRIAGPFVFTETFRLFGNFAHSAKRTGTVPASANAFLHSGTYICILRLSASPQHSSVNFIIRTATLRYPRVQTNALILWRLW